MMSRDPAKLTDFTRRSSTHLLHTYIMYIVLQ